MKRIVLITFFCYSLSVLYSQKQGLLSPINPDFIKYNDKIQSGNFVQYTNEGFLLGYLPPTTKPNFTNYTKVKSKGSFPALYDLRTLNKLTSVKNQGQCGACWTFATMASIESRWKALGLGDFDLSEDNMNNCHHFDYPSCQGGNINMSTSYLSRLSGPFSEADDKFTGAANSCPTGLSLLAYISDARFLPSDMDAIKQALTDYSAVYTAFYYSDSYYNKSNYTYYCSDISQPANHAVLIVGWDDNKITAGGTGAWIIKNSWASSWGEKGYFYISYNDVTVLSESGYFPNKVDYKTGSKVYCYDDLGWVRDWGFQAPSAYALIKFTSIDLNPLTKVGSWINTAGATIDIEIYDSFDGKVLSNLLSSLSNQPCPYPGYYSFDLPAPVQMSKGNDFYIKVKYNTPGNYVPIPVEAKYPGYSNPTIETGKCWASPDGNTWTALGTNTNYLFDLCIKAYAYSSCVPPTASITQTDSVFLCQGQSYTLFSNTAQGLNYQWSKNLNDIIGATNSSFTVTEAGNYSVIVSDNKFCAAVSAPVTVSVFQVDLPSLQTINCYDSIQLQPSVNFPIGNFVKLLQPFSIKYTKIGLAEFGQPIADCYVSGDLIYVKDNNNSYLGCATNGYSPNIFENKIALIDRGTCQFGYKALMAQKAGAKAVVIVDNKQNYGNPSKMSAGDYGAQVTIPTVIISITDGAYLKKLLVDSGYAKMSIGFDPGAYTFKWTPSEGLSSTTVPFPFSKPEKTTTYSLVVNDGKCTANAEVTVNIVGAPEVNLGKDTTICNDQTFTLDAGLGNYTYLWNDGSKSQKLIIDASKLNFGSYSYSVNVTNNKGCNAYDNININIVPVSYYTLSGIITYDNNNSSPLINTKLLLLNKEGLEIDNCITDNYGQYLFKNLRNGVYRINPVITIPWGGVDPNDALNILKSYVGLYEYTNDLRRQAADLNTDNFDNSIDAFYINKRYIDKISSYPSGDWLFDTESISVYQNNVTKNIKVICYGDVDGSYNFK